MLHEEVLIDWSVLQREINDAKTMETLKIDFTPRVSQETKRLMKWFIIGNCIISFFTLEINCIQSLLQSANNKTKLLSFTIF